MPGGKLTLIPLLVATTAAALLAAPTAAADCTSAGGSSLCSGGEPIVGSAGTPTDAYDPLPCAITDPVCSYYDTYDPGVIFDQPYWGIGGFGGTGGIGGIGGIGPR